MIDRRRPGQVAGQGSILPVTSAAAAATIGLLAYSTRLS